MMMDEMTWMILATVVADLLILMDGLASVPVLRQCLHSWPQSALFNVGDKMPNASLDY